MNASRFVKKVCASSLRVCEFFSISMSLCGIYLGDRSEDHKEVEEKKPEKIMLKNKKDKVKGNSLYSNECLLDHMWDWIKEFTNKPV